MPSPPDTSPPDGTEARLAVEGGQPVIPSGPPSWPPHDPGVQAAIAEAAADGSWGKYHGGHVSQLTELLAQMHGVEHAMTVCSGTFAVELALRALKIGAGNEVVLAGYDFGGNFRCIEAVGATPVLVDIDPSTWCLDASLVTAAIDPKRTRAILVSHLHGGTANMRELRRIADEHDLSLIEDACQAPGATVQGKMAGTWGDVGTLSFGGSKLLSAGRGGAIVTGDESVMQRAKVFCERGNETFPLSELQAAALIPQLATLAARNEQRLANVRQLLTACSDLPLKPVDIAGEGTQPAFYKLAWLYEPSDGTLREDLTCAARAEGVALDAGFRGFVRRGSRRCRRVGDLVHSARAAEATVLLHHPVLLESAETIDLIAIAINKVLKGLGA